MALKREGIIISFLWHLNFIFVARRSRQVYFGLSTSAIVEVVQGCRIKCLREGALRERREREGENIVKD